MGLPCSSHGGVVHDVGTDHYTRAQGHGLTTDAFNAEDSNVQEVEVSKGAAHFPPQAPAPPCSGKPVMLEMPAAEKQEIVHADGAHALVLRVLFHGIEYADMGLHAPLEMPAGPEGH